MKVLKAIFIVIGVLFGLQIIFNFFESKLKTAISFDGIDDKNAYINVFTNRKLTQKYAIPFDFLGTQNFKANQYTLTVNQVGGFMGFEIIDKNGISILKQIIQPKQNKTPFFILNEQ